MGSYAFLSVAGLRTESTKNDIDPTVMMLFRESDKEMLETTWSAINSDIEAGSEDDTPVRTLVYRASVGTFRDRLELLGFTLSLAEREFERARDEEILRQREFYAEYADSLKEGGIELSDSSSIAVTCKEWIAGLRDIRDDNLHLLDSDLRESLPPIVKYMVDKSYGWFGYPGYDIRLALRLSLEAFSDSEFVEYDLTDLLGGGWVDSEEDLLAHAEYLIAEDFAESRRIVVLTEGQTDKMILERSLKLLYPHLSDYFTFMDFEGARIGGGAGALANIVKAFVGAGILNRIIALFDNDTAGRSAVRSLSAVSIPSHISIQNYPPIGLADSYPTLGPTGRAEMNVNGLAGSIELYLGRDVLTDETGELAVVHWRGYDERMRQYQGEISSKHQIHERFVDKAKRSETDAEYLQRDDWSGLLAILDQMRSAFHHSDELAYLEEVAAMSFKDR